jgi:hypothetical protein
MNAILYQLYNQLFATHWLDNIIIPKRQIMIALKWGTCVIIDGAADSETKIRHFSSVAVAPREKMVYIFLQDFSKKKTLSIPVSCQWVRWIKSSKCFLWSTHSKILYISLQISCKSIYCPIFISPNPETPPHPWLPETNKVAVHTLRKTSKYQQQKRETPWKLSSIAMVTLHCKSQKVVTPNNQFRRE